jgi:hypothetical protein
MPDSSKPRYPEREHVSLNEAATHLLDECRMVLPGIQALFGFQLIAIFQQRFGDDLAPAEQKLHYAALVLVAVSIALIMTPAAYHRQRDVHHVSEAFIVLSTRLLLASMWPLAAGICLDVYLVGGLIFDSAVLALVPAALFALFILLWFVLPRSR